MEAAGFHDVADLAALVVACAADLDQAVTDLLGALSFRCYICPFSSCLRSMRITVVPLRDGHAPLTGCPAACKRRLDPDVYPHN
jgi:hypothetical protein